MTPQPDAARAASTAGAVFAGAPAVPAPELQRRNHSATSRTKWLTQVQTATVAGTLAQVSTETWGAMGTIVGAVATIIAAGIAFWQARSARDDAKSAWSAATAAEKQATEARRANEIAERAEADRLKDREQACPQLKVTARPTMRIEWSKNEDGSSRLIRGGLGEVIATVENKSTRDITINHAGIINLNESVTDIITKAGEHEFPAVLRPHHQFRWTIEGETVLGLVADDENESEIAVFASDTPWDIASDEQRWYSDPFIVKRSLD